MTESGQRYVDPANEEAVDAAVGAWHEGDGLGMSLHEYLGWSWEQYKEWM